MDSYNQSKKNPLVILALLTTSNTFLIFELTSLKK